MFGDSLSAGYGISRDTSWVSLLEQALQQEYPKYTVINASISGETSSGGQRRITQTLQQHHPDLVILELGANDGLRGTPLGETEKNLSRIILKIKKSGAETLLIGMKLPPNYGPSYTKKFERLYTRLAKKHGVTLMPFLLEGLTAQHFQADNLHPTAAAQPHIMRNVLHALTPLLE